MAGSYRVSGSVVRARIDGRGSSIAGPRYGELIRGCRPGSGSKDALRTVQQLPSGPHVVVAEAGRFALIRVQGTLAAQARQNGAALLGSRACLETDTASGPAVHAALSDARARPSSHIK